jgi:uncharacterized protein YndB with AHSA1/START domain
MPNIEHLIRIEASPRDIFTLVSTGKGFKTWWAEDVEDEAQGVVRLGFFNRTTIYTLTPRESVTASLASWRCDTGQEWTGTQLRFVLTPADGATLLQFTHADWQAATEYFRMCNTTWGELMYRLKAVAEGRSPGPLFLKSGLAY